MGRVRKRDVEAPPFRPPTKRGKTGGHRPPLGPCPSAAVGRAHDLMRDLVQPQEVDGLRVVARGHLDLVSPRVEKCEEWTEERDLRRVRNIDPDAHGVTLASSCWISFAYGHAPACRVLRGRPATAARGGGRLTASASLTRSERGPHRGPVRDCLRS